MWDRLSEFLFDSYAVAGFQFENWMWLIGVPVLIICVYFSERGFHRTTRDMPRDPPGG
jgi:hypothetical protein